MMQTSLGSTAECALDKILGVVGPSSVENPISLHEPDFTGTNAWSYVKDCLDTSWVSTAGSWVNSFEKGLCTITGAQHAVVVNNGTNALRLALHLVGVGPGDEVLLPPLSFVATANAVAHLGAVPHFVDVNPSDLGICPAALSAHLDSITYRRDSVLINRETGRRIGALLPVHVFGHPAQVDQLRAVADTFGLPMVEDAAEALSSFRAGTHCGMFGSVGTVSFNGNKLITTGGGGALLTNDASLALRARHLSTTAKKPHPWLFEHDAIGWNDRLPNLNAALGCAQLEDLERRLEAKRNLAKLYSETFADVEGVELVEEPTDCRSNHWLVTLRFTAEDPLIAQGQRMQLMQRSHSVGLLLRPVWTPLHQLPMYNGCPQSSLSVANNEALRLVNLPSSPQLWKGWLA